MRSRSPHTVAALEPTSSVTTFDSARPRTASAACASNSRAADVTGFKRVCPASSRSRSRMSPTSRISRSVLSTAMSSMRWLWRIQCHDAARGEQPERTAQRRQWAAQFVADRRDQLVPGVLGGAALGDVAERHDRPTAIFGLDQAHVILDRQAGPVFAPAHLLSVRRQRAVEGPVAGLKVRAQGLADQLVGVNPQQRAGNRIREGDVPGRVDREDAVSRGSEDCLGREGVLSRPRAEHRERRSLQHGLPTDKVPAPRNRTPGCPIRDQGPAIPLILRPAVIPSEAEESRLTERRSSSDVVLARSLASSG